MGVLRLECLMTMLNSVEAATLDIKRSKVHHILSTTCRTPESQISVHFTLWTAILKLQSIVRQVHRITPKWPWTLWSQRYYRYLHSLATTTQESHISLCFTLRPAIFKLLVILEQVHQWSQYGLEHLKSQRYRYSIYWYILLLPTSHKFESVVLCDCLFSR